MKLFRIISFLVLCSIGLFTCIDPPEYPDQPIITYEGVNQTTVYQGSPNLPLDTLQIYFSFTDGDGDLSLQDTTDIFLYDSRFPSTYTAYKIPEIPDEGTGNGIRGEITLSVPNSNNICCIDNGFACPPNASIDTDTFSYILQIRDEAGNISNRISTETITITCRQ